MRRRMPAGPPGTVARRGATRRTSSSLAKFVTTVPVRLDPGGLVPSSKFRRVRAHTRPAFLKHLAKNTRHSMRRKVETSIDGRAQAEACCVAWPTVARIGRKT